MSYRAYCESIAGDLLEHLGTGENLVLTGTQSALFRGTISALGVRFFDESPQDKTALLVVMSRKEAGRIRQTLSRTEFDIPSPTIQVATPCELEQWLTTHQERIEALSRHCCQYFIWLTPTDFEDASLLYWLDVWKRLPQKAGIIYLGWPDMPIKQLEKAHPSIRHIEHIPEKLGMRPVIRYFFETESPENAISEDFWSLCQKKDNLVFCHHAHQKNRYSEASSRHHIPVFDFEYGLRPKKSHHQEMVTAKHYHCRTGEENWGHLVFIDPDMKEDLGMISDDFLNKPAPVTVLVGSHISLLNAISGQVASEEIPETEKLVFEAYHYYSRLCEGDVPLSSFKTGIGQCLINHWFREKIAEIDGDTVQLGPNSKKLFLGIKPFSQLGILWLYHHDTTCVTLNHEWLGELQTSFLRQETSGRFYYSGKMFQKQFHNLLESESNLKVNMDPGYPVWLDALPEVFSRKRMHVIGEIVLGQRDDCSSFELDETSHQALSELRNRFKDVPGEQFIEVTPEAAHWWTFFGARLNALLSWMIQATVPRLRVSYGNFYLRLSWEGNTCSAERIVDRLKAISRGIQALCHQETDWDRRKAIFEYWKRKSSWQWSFVLLPEMLLEHCFSAELKSLHEALGDVEIPVFLTSQLRVIDNLPLLFEEQKSKVLQSLSVPLASESGKCRGGSGVFAQQKAAQGEPSPSPKASTNRIEIQRGNGERMHTRYPWTYVDTGARLSDALNVILKQRFIGLDVETTLYDQRLCLIQIGCSDQSFIIDPLCVDISDLRHVFSHPDIEKVIHNSSFECRVLGNLGMQIHPIVDTLKVSRKIYGMKCPGGHSLKAVCMREFGYEMDKENQTSCWSRRPLSAEQLEYAALDAEILVHLYRHFKLG